MNSQYSIKQLCTPGFIGVIHIETREEYNSLKVHCPKMTKYDSDFKYYMTANNGYSKTKGEYNSTYTIIELFQIPELNIKSKEPEFSIFN